MNKLESAFKDGFQKESGIGGLKKGVGIFYDLLRGSKKDRLTD